MAVNLDGVLDSARFGVGRSDYQAWTIRTFDHVAEVGNGMCHACTEMAAWHQDTRDLAHDAIEVVDHLEHVVGNDNVEGRVNERQPRAVRDDVLLIVCSSGFRCSDKARGWFDRNDAVTTRGEIASDAALTATHFEGAQPGR